MTKNTKIPAEWYGIYRVTREREEYFEKLVCGSAKSDEDLAYKTGVFQALDDICLSFNSNIQKESINRAVELTLADAKTSKVNVSFRLVGAGSDNVNGDRIPLLQYKTLAGNRTGYGMAKVYLQTDWENDESSNHSYRSHMKNNHDYSFYTGDDLKMKPLVDSLNICEWENMQA